MLEVLYDPDAFFDRRSKGDVSLRGPGLIVFLNALVAMVPVYLTMNELMGALPEQARAFAGVGVVIGAVSAFIGIFAYWILGSALIHALTSFLGGRGSFRRTVEYVGYGFLPSVLGAAIGALVLWQVLPTVEFSVADPEATAQALQENEAVALSSVANAVFFLWSANIWIFGTMRHRGLSRKQSLLAIGIPVAILIAWQLRTAAPAFL